MINIKTMLRILFLSLVISQLLSQESKHTKVGLVLSGGGAKGFAHIGTLEILDSLGIKPDFIVGTSMGGIIGGLYSIGYTGKEIEALAYRTDWTELFTDTPARNLLPHFIKKNKGKYQVEFGLKGFTPVVPSGIVQGQKISQLFAKLAYGYENVEYFDSLPIPFRCVSVDVASGEEVVLSKGPLSKAMRATMSIPTVFSPVEWDDYILIDGGVLNNFPVDIAKNKDMDFIIGSNVGAPKKLKEDLNSFLDLLDQTINIPGYPKEEVHSKMTNILVTPEIASYSAQDFNDDDVHNIVGLGKEAAYKKIDQFIALSKKLNEERPLKPDTTKFIRATKPLGSNQTIHGIIISGNESLPFYFIYNLIGLKPGDKFDINYLDQQINEVYGLGYFESINYQIEKVTEKSIRLLITVKEKPLRKLFIGLKYNDQYKLVGIVGTQVTNLPFPGMRLESELQFAGLTKFQTKISYPTRSLDFPIYPFIRFNYKNVPLNIFDENATKIASYSDNSVNFAFGVGLSLNKFWVLEASYDLEYMNIEPNIAATFTNYFPSWKDKLHKIQLSLDFDLLDDYVFPRQGILVQSNLERSYKELGSDINYWRMDASADIYVTIEKYHTLRFCGFYGISSPNLPKYKEYFMGGPESFVGTDFNQLIASKLGIIRFGYRYQYRKDIYLKGIVNFAFDYNNSGQELPTGHKIIWGYGGGIEFLTPVGPIELLITNGEKSFLNPGDKKIAVYITAGYKF
jgi:NTE family protein